MYRMLFFENEDFDLSRERALYVSLLSLKTVGWTEEDLKNHNLSDILYDLCDSFYYPEGSDDMIYFNSFPMRDKRGLRRIRWTPDGSLERYLNEYRYLLNYWDEVILDNYLELFDNKFALIRNGKYKHHLITGKKNSDSDMSLCIWTEKIFVEEKQHEFSFRNNDELKKFLLDNRIVFDSFISNDFFLDEKSYILKYRKKFYENDLDGIGYGSADPFTMGKRDK
jgi:hypothetical protein